mmetsp:Transcript_4707/g.8032  ORF Transcript_4707/g.8032 Transcript_4707/m.8032 type:complete len:94 (-) Transcript_4707:1647-1928(-)
MAGSLSEKLKQNASSIYEKNYHGQIAAGLSTAVSSAATKAQQIKHINRKWSQNEETLYGEEELSSQHGQDQNTHGESRDRIRYSDEQEDPLTG